MTEPNWNSTQFDAIVKTAEHSRHALNQLQIITGFLAVNTLLLIGALGTLLYIASR